MTLRSALPYVLVTLVVVLSLAGGLVGYVLGSRSGADLDVARDAGREAGEGEAALQITAARRTKTFERGRRQGYRRAYRRAFAAAKAKVLAAAPMACGDADASDTPTLERVRAEGVACDEALAFVRSVRACQDLSAGCQGWSCSIVSIAWESSEITCTSGPRRVRFITGV
jgi:hypothetical protein